VIGHAATAGRRGAGSLVVECRHRDVGFPIVVAHADAPRIAAHLTVLDVLLRRPAAGIERDLDRLAAVRTLDRRVDVGGAITKGKFVVEVELVVRQAHREGDRGGSRVVVIEDTPVPTTPESYSGISRPSRLVPAGAGQNHPGGVAESTFA
jgi:hypothetical protein